MNPDSLSFYRNWLEDYACLHESPDPLLQKNIDLKIRHTFRVCDDMGMIGASLGLGEDDLSLAEAIALFHDVGRFEQLQRFGSFDDRISADHALLDLKALNGWEGFFDLPAKERAIVLLRPDCLPACDLTIKERYHGHILFRHPSAAAIA